MLSRRFLINLVALSFGLYLGMSAAFAFAAGTGGPTTPILGLEVIEQNDLLFIITVVVLWAFGYSAGVKR